MQKISFPNFLFFGVLLRDFYVMRVGNNQIRHTYIVFIKFIEYIINYMSGIVLGEILICE